MTVHDAEHMLHQAEDRVRYWRARCADAERRAGGDLRASQGAIAREIAAAYKHLGRAERDALRWWSQVREEKPCPTAS